jgi:BirA family biotin operon repressor/biotin-[acetyl-CoA-carboxylase] ligase
MKIINVVKKHYLQVENTMIDFYKLGVTYCKDTCYIITTDFQTNGVATKGRSWYSPPSDNLYITYIFPIQDTEINNSKQFRLNVDQVTSLAIVEILESLGISAGIKWMNDVLINNKKICGVLSKRVNFVEDGNIYLLYVGVGVNVNMTKQELKNIDQQATSIKIELKKKYNKNEIEHKISTKIIEYISTLLSVGFSSFFESIDKKIQWKNKNVRINLSPRHKKEYDDSNNIDGKIIGIDHKGYLLIQSGNVEQVVEYGSLKLLD